MIFAPLYSSKWRFLASHFGNWLDWSHLQIGVPEVDQGRVLEGLLGRLSSGFKSKAGCWCGSHPSDLQARPAVGVSKGAPGAQSSTGYPLDLEARPVAPVVNSIAAGAGFRSEAGCWCGSYPLDLEARPVVGVKF